MVLVDVDRLPIVETQGFWSLENFYFLLFKLFDSKTNLKLNDEFKNCLSPHLAAQIPTYTANSIEVFAADRHGYTIPGLSFVVLTWKKYKYFFQV